MEKVTSYEIGTNKSNIDYLPMKAVSYSYFRATTVAFLLLALFFTTPSRGNDWVEVEVGVDSGDTYLWPYFYTASRFIDINSIEKDSGHIVYRELVDSIESKSQNVISLIVEKKSKCDGKAVLWKSFVIFDSKMGQGKAIMKLVPNESEPLETGSAGSITDAFVCNLNQ